MLKTAYQFWKENLLSLLNRKEILENSQRADFFRRYNLAISEAGIELSTMKKALIKNNLTILQEETEEEFLLYIYDLYSKSFVSASISKMERVHNPTHALLQKLLLVESGLQRSEYSMRESEPTIKEVDRAELPKKGFYTMKLQGHDITSTFIDEEGDTPEENHLKSIQNEAPKTTEEAVLKLEKEIAEDKLEDLKAALSLAEVHIRFSFESLERTYHRLNQKCLIRDKTADIYRNLLTLIDKEGVNSYIFLRNLLDFKEALEADKKPAKPVRAEKYFPKKTEDNDILLKAKASVKAERK